MSGPHFCERQHHSALSVLAAVFPRSSQRMSFPSHKILSAVPDCARIFHQNRCAYFEIFSLFVKQAQLRIPPALIPNNVLIFPMSLVVFGANDEDFDIIVVVVVCTYH